MYRADIEGTDLAVTPLKESDIQRWSADLGMPRGALYDLLALHLASGFHRNELPFRFCDHVATDISGVIVLANEALPNLFWSVYLAFDKGEYYHGNDRTENPVDAYTRPMIAKIINQFGPP